MDGCPRRHAEDIRVPSLNWELEESSRELDRLKIHELVPSMWTSCGPHGVLCRHCFTSISVAQGEEICRSKLARVLMGQGLVLQAEDREVPGSSPIQD